MDVCVPVDVSKRLDEINPKLRRDLTNSIGSSWETVLRRLPDNFLRQLDLDGLRNKLKTHGIKAPNLMFDLLGKRGGKLEHLIYSFEQLKLENCLKIIGKPKIPQKIIPKFSNYIELEVGSRLTLEFESTGFPYPTHVFYKNNEEIYVGNPLVINEIRPYHSGVYYCKVYQDETVQPVIFQTYVKVTYDGVTLEPLKAQDLQIDLSPIETVASLGSEITLTAKVTVKHPYKNRKFKYQWYKCNTNGDEIIRNNPTAQTNRLFIENLQLEDEGKYTCHVSTDTISIFVHEACNVKLKFHSDFDLKIALIIGNGEYIRFQCDECDSSNYGFDNLSVTNDLIELKKLLEKMNFIVMAYLDLNENGFLRVIALLKELCKDSQNVLIYVYIGGHGRHDVPNDYLVPVDLQDYVHKCHNEGLPVKKFVCCSLMTLIETFASDDCDEKFSIICFWDLCRDTNIDVLPDSYSVFGRNLDYNIIYSCNVGKYAYEVHNGKIQGSIVLDSFFKIFKENLTLNQILCAMNKDLVTRKRKDPTLNVVEGVKLHTTVSREYFLATRLERRNLPIERKLKTLYYTNHTNDFTEVYCLNEKGDKLIISFCYRFISDVFLNTIVLQITTKENIEISMLIVNDGLLRREVLPALNTYRIKGLHLLDSKDMEVKIKFTSEEYETMHGLITLNNTELNICKNLYSQSVNQYVHYKQIRCTNTFDPIHSPTTTSTTSCSPLSYQNSDYDTTECVNSGTITDVFENLQLKI